MNLDKSRIEKFYRQMLRIRRFEEKVHELYLNKKLWGMSPHLSIGQEAVAVGVCENLKPSDYILTSHRGHGHTLAKGAEMGPMLAELCGKDTGYCKGRGGSMHIADTSSGNLGANGIVGAGLPIAVGVGLSIIYRKTDQVVVCFFGEGATNQGTFHESLNFASVKKLPVIFVCENNIYALSTPITKTCAVEHIADRAAAYNMPGELVDGMDVEAVYEKASSVIERARHAKGPVLLECITYRFFGHGASDHRPYRTREEENEWKKRGPLISFKEKIISKIPEMKGVFEKIEKEVDEEVNQAVSFVENSPEPDPADVLKYVYS